jgi:hypothetical protein
LKLLRFQKCIAKWQEFGLKNFKKPLMLPKIHNSESSNKSENKNNVCADFKTFALSERYSEAVVSTVFHLS